MNKHTHPTLQRVQYALLFAAMLAPQVLLAHPGHDHDHWSGAALHAMLYVSAGLCVVSIVMALRKGIHWLDKKRQPSAATQ